MSCHLCVCVFFSFCRLCCILELKTGERWFVQRVHLYVWAIRRHELGTLSIRVHNSLTVHENSCTLKFDNFSKFQNFISDSPSTFQRHYDTSRTKIDMRLTPKLFLLLNLLMQAKYIKYLFANLHHLLKTVLSKINVILQNTSLSSNRCLLTPIYLRTANC